MNWAAMMQLNSSTTSTKYRMNFGVVGADVPAVQGAQVGDAADAAGVALLSDDQDGEDRRDRLRDDRKVHTADPALEHRGADDEGEDGGHQQDREHRKREAVNGFRKKGSCVIWFQSMKSGMLASTGSLYSQRWTPRA